jgi:hypothetical protein
MSRKFSCALLSAILVLWSACSKKPASPLIVEIPSGFSGNFVLEMGVRDAPPLAKRGDAYLVLVPKDGPRDGKVSTSTLLLNPRPSFHNASGGTVWGYSHSLFTTGDGIPIGGKIEFFVGTKQEFEAEQSRKKHSGTLLAPAKTIGLG